jgi:hypothetical protein
VILEFATDWTAIPQEAKYQGENPDNEDGIFHRMEIGCRQKYFKQGLLTNSYPVLGEHVSMFGAGGRFHSFRTACIVLSEANSFMQRPPCLPLR